MLECRKPPFICVFHLFGLAPGSEATVVLAMEVADRLVIRTLSEGALSLRPKGL